MGRDDPKGVYVSENKTKKPGEIKIQRVPAEIMEEFYRAAAERSVNYREAGLQMVQIWIGSDPEKIEAWIKNKLQAGSFELPSDILDLVNRLSEQIAGIVSLAIRKQLGQGGADGDRAPGGDQSQAGAGRGGRRSDSSQQPDSDAKPRRKMG